MMTTDLHHQIRRAARQACAPGAAAAHWPLADHDGTDLVLNGPEAAHLRVTARLDHTGAVTGAAWRGRGADGAAIHGHGSPDAAIRTARAWAADLDERPAVTPVELRARREATGASQTDLARRMGTTQGTISQWENGSRAPRDPDDLAAAINDLETLADTLYQQALDTAATTGTLAVWDTDHDYWAADPTAAQQRIPAAMHRVAAARAAHHHTRTGTNTRIIPANTPHKTQER